MAPWNWIDWILAAIVFISVVTAILEGLVRELISLAAVILAVIVAVAGYRRVAGGLDDLTRSHDVALAVAFLAIFIAVLIVGSIVSALTARMVRTAGLGWFDRFLGGVFGLVRGILIDCVLLMVLVAFAIKPALVARSQLAPYVTAGTRVIVLAMPADLRSHFRTGLDKFRRSLQEIDREARGH